MRISITRHVTAARRRLGFNLVELLVVVAILSVLVSILVPSLGRVRKLARRAYCLSNLHGHSNAIATYTNDHDGKTMPAYDNGLLWMDLLPPYYQTDAIRFCPEAKEVLWQAGAFRPGGARNAWFTMEGRDDWSGSYGINEWINSTGGWGWQSMSDCLWRSLNASPSQLVPVMLDCFWHGGYPLETDVPHPSELDCEPVWDPQMNRYCIRRHGEMINACFVDGSARGVKLPDLWTLKWHKNMNPPGALLIPWLQE